MTSTPLLDKSLAQRFMDKLEFNDKVQVEYVWIDGSGVNLRSKTKTVPKGDATLEKLGIWNFDGSSTGQAAGGDSDVFLKPVKVCKDPFRTPGGIIALCETLDNKMEPHVTNNRQRCAETMEKAKGEKPWFGMEQEYTIFNGDGGQTPFGWPKGGFPGPQGPYYCGVGATKAYGRDLVEAHYRACLYAGIDICGTNAEVMPGQWEFQVGPCEGIEMGDQLWIARYLLHRTAEEFGLDISLDPKPKEGDWNGAGCHTNFSTQAMRKPGGYKHILAAIQDGLANSHHEHIAYYDPSGGKDNERRLTGRHETAAIDKFTFAVAGRNCSVRIPRQTHIDGYGYFEDRRPSSNCDPYLVTDAMVRTICLGQKKLSRSYLPNEAEKLREMLAQFHEGGKIRED